VSRINITTNSKNGAIPMNEPKPNTPDVITALSPAQLALQAAWKARNRQPGNSYDEERTKCIDDFFDFLRSSKEISYVARLRSSERRFPSEVGPSLPVAVDLAYSFYNGSAFKKAKLTHPPARQGQQKKTDLNLLAEIKKRSSRLQTMSIKYAIIWNIRSDSKIHFNHNCKSDEEALAMLRDALVYELVNDFFYPEHPLPCFAMS